MSDLPISYWVKHLDRLIEDAFDRSLAAESLDRSGWQVLHSLHQEPAAPEELEQRLAPFLDEDGENCAHTVEQLRARGWVQAGDRLSVTPQGTRVHRAVLERVEQSRHRLHQGIDQQRYRAAVLVLEQMSANLESP